MEAVETIPPPAALIDIFSGFGQLCYSNNTPRAAELILKSRHILDSERRKWKNSNVRQLMLTDIWKTKK